MNHLKVVYRHTDKDSGRWKRIFHATAIALMVSLAAAIGSVGLVESIKYFCNVLIKLSNEI